MMKTAAGDFQGQIQDIRVPDHSLLFISPPKRNHMTMLFKYGSVFAGDSSSFVP